MNDKKYYNSVEWEILKHDLKEVRNKGIKFLKQNGFNT